MGFHHLSFGRNNHQPYRWIVSNSADRLDISTNSDGSPITIDDGLYCRCLQLDDLSEWVLSSIDPVEWVAAGGGGGSGKLKEVLFDIQSPQGKIVLPIEYNSSNMFMGVTSNRTTPYIFNNLGAYSYFLFAITEYESSGEVVNQTKDLQFSDYSELVDSLNLHLTMDNNNFNEYGFSVQCYAYTDEDGAVSNRIVGTNRLFGMLRGKRNYKSTTVKTIQPSDSWSAAQTFVNQVYSDFLNVTPPSLSNAFKTIWVPQTSRRAYLKSGNTIQFKSGITGSRMYYNKPNGVPYNVSGGNWDVNSSRLYYLSGDSINNIDSDDELHDYSMINVDSIVRVSMLTNGVAGRYAWIVKPVGMDLFKLGWTKFSTKENAELFMEIRGRDSSTRIYKLDTVQYNLRDAFCNQISRSVTKASLLSKMVGSMKYHTAGNNQIFRAARFFYADGTGMKTQPTKWVEFSYRQSSDSPRLMLQQIG